MTRPKGRALPGRVRRRPGSAGIDAGIDKRGGSVAAGATPAPLPHRPGCLQYSGRYRAPRSPAPADRFARIRVRQIAGRRPTWPAAVSWRYCPSVWPRRESQKAGRPKRSAQRLFSGSGGANPHCRRRPVRPGTNPRSPVGTRSRKPVTASSQARAARPGTSGDAMGSLGGLWPTSAHIFPTCCRAWDGSARAMSRPPRYFRRRCQAP